MLFRSDITQVGPYYTLRHSVYTNNATPGVNRHSRRPTFTIRENQPGNPEKNPSFFASYNADGHQISLESCFKPGVNYKALLAATYNEQALIYVYPSVEESQIENFNFTIGYTGFEFFFTDLGDYGYIGIEYKSLGSENLTIFNQ